MRHAAQDGISFETQVVDGVRSRLCDRNCPPPGQLCVMVVGEDHQTI